MNVFRGGRSTWFPVPTKLVRDGLLVALSGSTTKAYLTLLYLAGSTGAVDIAMPDHELQDFTGLDHKTGKKARGEMDQAKLVSSRPVNGVMSYTLMDPEGGLPLRRLSDRSGVRRYVPRPGRSARTARAARQQMRAGAAEIPAYPVAWDEISPAEGREPGEEAPVPAGEDSRHRSEALPTAAGKVPDAALATCSEHEVYFGA